MTVELVEEAKKSTHACKVVVSPEFDARLGRIKLKLVSAAYLEKHR